MGGATIRIEVDDRPVVDALNRLVAASADLRPVLKVIGEHMVQSTELRFDRQTTPDGAQWAPLSPQTRASKKHAKILTESQRLRRSIVYQVTGDGAVEVGTNVVYAAIHQFGGTIERAAHSSWGHLRVDARGRLIRQGSQGKSANLAVFAKASHKRKTQVKFTVGAHGIEIPARPFLGLSIEDRQTILEDLNDYLARAMGGRS